MKKIHVQLWAPITKIAEVTKALHDRRIYRVKPADILRFCLDLAHETLQAKQLNEDEALRFLQSIGYFVPEEVERKRSFINALSKKKVAMEELEELIERVGKGPSTPDEVKEMLSQSPERGEVR